MDNRASWVGPIDFVFADGLWLSWNISREPKKRMKISTGIMEIQTIGFGPTTPGRTRTKPATVRRDTSLMTTSANAPA